jgi:hypothetical protein
MTLDVPAVTLPDRLPSIATARLPKSYESAKAALATCTRVDECKAWADKAGALASYARQAKDRSLRTMAERIQARAIQRCGQLLQAIQPARGANQNISRGAPTKVTRTSAARDAGLSTDQKVQALRVANVPTDEFDRLVEAEQPATVTELARRGRESRTIVDLEGRDPADYAVATQTLGAIRRFHAMIQEVPVAQLMRGTKTYELKALREHIAVILSWAQALSEEIEPR